MVIVDWGCLLEPTENNPPQDLIAKGQTRLSLQGESARACDDNGKECKSNLDTHEYPGDVVFGGGWRCRPGEVGQDEIFKDEIEYANDNHQSATDYTIHVRSSILWASIMGVQTLT